MRDEQPSAVTMTRTHRWQEQLAGVLAREGMSWPVPHYTVGPNREAMFEWGLGESRSLTVYITDDHVAYVASWGCSVSAEMVDGQIETDEAILQAFRWLAGQADTPLPSGAR